ncbi:MAG TPA: phosphatase PAP2 family protein [Elusimicrobiales bacterium]|nr:phosphatase PAP2 family protein [Elusimicrobiales bacterium]
MRINFRSCVRFLPFLAALVLCACANPDKIRVKYTGPYPDPHYLSEAQIERLVKDFPPPPAPGSEQEKADWATLLDWQAKRTPLQCAAALVQEKSDFPEYYGGDANPFIKPEPQPVLDFFRRMGEDVKTASARLKKHARRARPEGPQLHPCLRDVGSKYSYPSIHASTSRAFALILADFAPARRQEFLDSADQAALNRLIAGVHFPSDIAAGKEYGARVYAELLKNETFQREMETLRQYLAK